MPGRFRAALRILVGCLVALVLTAVIGSDLVPHGHWAITTVFTVSQADAGASLRKSIQRIVGTLAGGLVGVLVVIAFADLPTVFVPLLGAIAGFGIFASLTTSAPYVMLLGSLTFVLVAFVPPDAVAPDAVATGLWRILAITMGVACGTGAQLFLWPDDPEDKLRQVVARRLNAVAAATRRLALREEDDPASAAAPTAALASDDLTAQLDLLANAEARHPSLRQRHTEQLALIVEVDRLLTTAVWLADAAVGWTISPEPELMRELRAVAEECAALAEALAAGRPPANPPPDLEASGAGEGVPGLRPTLDDMRLALQRARGALSFLDPDRVVAPALDHPTQTPLLTPAFSAKNTEAIALALKTALGFELCYVLMWALDWPALLTAAVTVILIAQTSFGAIIQKSMLRLGGAMLGGALGIATIIVAMPNIESLGALVLVAGVGFAIASWITAGSSRISYVGFQAGMAFAMCVTDPSGPTTDLTTGRDRVIGIFVGVLAVLLVNAMLGPARARLAMWPAFGRALRSIASLARFAPEARDYRAHLAAAVRFRSAVYQQLAATLRLSGESALEPDAREAEPERDWVARLTAHAQAVFLGLLALIRHRLAPEFPVLPPTVQEAVREVDWGVGETLEALADRIDRRPVRPLPDLPSRLAALEALVPPEESESSRRGSAVAARVAARDHVAIARDLVRQVALLGEAVDAAAASRAR